MPNGETTWKVPVKVGWSSSIATTPNSGMTTVNFNSFKPLRSAVFEDAEDMCET